MTDPKKQIAHKLSSASKIAIFHHINVDRDSLACSYGLALALRKIFPKKEIVWVADQAYIVANFPYLKFDFSFVVKTIDRSFLTIIGDACVYERVHAFTEFQKGHLKICFDHHLTSPNFDVHVLWQEPTWIASALQAIKIVEELKVKWDEEIAFWFAIGILSDSNNFVYSLADPRPVLEYGQLLQHLSNVRLEEYFARSREKSLESLKLSRFIMSNLHFSQHVIYFVASKSTVLKFGQKLISDSIGMLANVQNYPIWAIFTEQTDFNHEYAWKVSIRSNQHEIQSVAARFQGGGHLKASGAKLKNKRGIRKILSELDALVEQP